MTGREMHRFHFKRLRQLWHLVRKTLQAFNEYECGLRAAALAYHLLLSIFPLLLFLVFLGSNVLSSQGVRQSLHRYLEETLPTVADSVGAILDQTVRARGAIGITGGLLLLWSASSVFISLSSTLNVIWNASPRPFWRSRILALVTVLSIGSLFIISVWFSALSPWSWPGMGTAPWLSYGLDLLVTVLLIGLIYRLLPNGSVTWRAALVGASLAGILWQGSKFMFAWFLSSGLMNYGLVYGSLASVVSLMLWTYLSGVILFLGATFGSALEKHCWLVGKERK